MKGTFSIVLSGPQLWGAAPTYTASLPTPLHVDPTRRGGAVCSRGPGRSVQGHHAQHLRGWQLRG